MCAFVAAVARGGYRCCGLTAAVEPAAQLLPGTGASAAATLGHVAAVATIIRCRLATAAVVAAVAALVALAIAALRRCALMGSGFVPTPSPAGGRWPSARPSSDGQVFMMRAMSVCVCVMCAWRALFCVTGDVWARPFVGSANIW